MYSSKARGRGKKLLKVHFKDIKTMLGAGLDQKAVSRLSGWSMKSVQRVSMVESYDEYLELMGKNKAHGPVTAPITAAVEGDDVSQKSKIDKSNTDTALTLLAESIERLAIATEASVELNRVLMQRIDNVALTQKPSRIPFLK